MAKRQGCDTTVEVGFYAVPVVDALVAEPIGVDGPVGPVSFFVEEDEDVSV